PRVLDQVDLALINTNYALEAGLNPTTDALAIEGEDSPYANILVTRSDNKDAEAVDKLVNALQSDEVKAFIEEKYKGAVVPAFCLLDQLYEKPLLRSRVRGFFWIGSFLTAI